MLYLFLSISQRFEFCLLFWVRQVNISKPISKTIRKTQDSLEVEVFLF